MDIGIKGAKENMCMPASFLFVALCDSLTKAGLSFKS